MSQITSRKTLYNYQEEAINSIFYALDEAPNNYHLLFQLPTGGGKTVIFSEIVRRYIERTNKKVVVLTHRIELSKQTSRMLTEFGVQNKVINSQVKDLPDQDDYMCFVAMVETLNNRLQDGKLALDQIGLVIIDEAHYNSFSKLFQYFDNSVILGVTATPLSSNIKLPMKDNYNELITGCSIKQLIEEGFLASANTYKYDVGLTSLKVGASGDYTVKSSEELYGHITMLDKLLHAYEEKAKGTKTLIFNNGINTSWHVYYTFKEAGHNVRHLDSTIGSQERKEILEWFKETPDAVLTSVGILTTGFDEPTIETIIINRATKSLALYFQMIGRGSRILPEKKEFTVIDLGNNLLRFGLWDSYVDWQKIFKSPNYYLENIKSDEDIEMEFISAMSDAVRAKFPKSENVEFDVRKEYKTVVRQGLKSKEALNRAMEQHAKICFENSEDVYDAWTLANLLDEDIKYRIKQYSYCIMKSSKNYLNWLEEDYKKTLRAMLNKMFNDLES